MVKKNSEDTITIEPTQSTVRLYVVEVTNVRLELDKGWKLLVPVFKRLFVPVASTAAAVVTTC